MSMTDPIADLLTRVRNALLARHATVAVPASRMKLAIVSTNVGVLSDGEARAKKVGGEVLCEVW